MINEEFKIEKKEAQGYDPLPENVYQVELLDITVDNRPTYDTRNKPDSEKVYEKVFNFQFTLLGGRDMKKGEDLRGRNIWQNFVPTFLYISQKNGKNDLYQIIEAILGHEMSPAEEANMDTAFLNGLIGAQCRVLVKNNTKGDKTYSNIENFLPIELEAPRLTSEEKEKARVKKESQEAQHENTAPNAEGVATVNGEEINVNNVDFGGEQAAA